MRVLREKKKRKKTIYLDQHHRVRLKIRSSVSAKGRIPTTRERARALAELSPSPSSLSVCIDEVVSKMADFLPSRSLLSVCFPNCLLTSGEVEQLRKSKEIDKCINRDKTYVKRLVKILLLGAGESGKSTFLKQMRIIHGQDFDQRAKEDFRATIYSNVIKGKTTPKANLAVSRVWRPARFGFVCGSSAFWRRSRWEVGSHASRR